MKTCRLLALVFLVQMIVPVSAAIIEATTDDGRKVVLSPDGTWKFKESATSSEHKGDWVKPSAATEVIKSQKGFFELWYNPEKWSKKLASKNDAAEFSLQHRSGDAYAMALVERIAIPQDSLRKMALDNAKSAAPDAKIVMDEERTVNGVKVKAMQIEGTIQGIPFKYYGYYWTGKAGTLQLLTFTSQNLFDEVMGDFTDLLNGAVITKE